MALTPTYNYRNNAVSTVTVFRPANETSLTVNDGSSFSGPFPVRLSVLRFTENGNPFGDPVAIFKATALTGNTFTLDGTLEGSNDADVLIGDFAFVGQTAADLYELWAALNQIELTPGADGNVWRHGTTPPSNTLGSDNDYYINTATYDVYYKSSGNYSIIGNLKGSPGVKGDAGDPGSVLRHGSGAPASGLGINGDYYLNSTTGDLYFKASGSYSIVANLKGPAGSAGVDGTPGTVLRNGSGAPNNSLGINGDYYLNTVTGDLYLKSSGSYTNVGSLKGPQGEPGQQGVGSFGVQMPSGFTVANSPLTASGTIVVNTNLGDGIVKTATGGFALASAGVDYTTPAQLATKADTSSILLLNNGGAVAAGATNITVNDARGLRVGDLIGLENEIVRIAGINANQLNIGRGASGTTAASHPDKIPVRLVLSSLAMKTPTDIIIMDADDPNGYGIPGIFSTEDGLVIGVDGGVYAAQMAIQESAITLGVDLVLTDGASGLTDVRTFALAQGVDLAVGDNLTTNGHIVAYSGKIAKIKVQAKTNGSTGGFTLRIKNNGTSIFASNPTVANNDTAVKTFVPTTTMVTENDTLTIDCVSAGAGVQYVIVQVIMLVGNE